MLQVLETVAVKLSQFILESFNAGRGTEVVAIKEDDVTREVDLAAEEMAYRMLRESFNEGGVLYTEEQGVYRWGDGRYIFILDPLDGSHNYAVGIPFFSISLAAGRYREGNLSDLEYAVVAIPPTGDIYTADPIRGARKNGVEIRRGKSNIVFAAISNHFPEKTCDVIRKMGLRGRSLGSSAAELIYTAEGKALGFIDLRGKLRMLDVAGALTFGKYIPDFRYVLYGGETATSRVSIIAGEKHFVDATLSS